MMTCSIAPKKASIIRRTMAVWALGTIDYDKMPDAQKITHTRHSSAAFDKRCDRESIKTVHRYCVESNYFKPRREMFSI